MTSVELDDFLCSLVEKVVRPFAYFPNRGNAGDALIYASEMQIFKRIGLNAETVTDINAPLKGKTILYSGGGNLNNLYHNCAKFLESNDKPELDNLIVLLPHSIFGREQLLASLSDRVIIVCRERQTLVHVLQHFPHKENVFISHDAAFYANMNELFERSSESPTESKTLTCMRTDAEKTSAAFDAKANVDVSRLFPDQSFLSGPKRIGCARDFLAYIDKYTHVKTNRLHVCIAAAKLGKTVEFYGNSYFKNEAVFNHSFPHFKLDKNVRFVKDV